MIIIRVLVAIVVVLIAASWLVAIRLTAKPISSTPTTVPSQPQPAPTTRGNAPATPKRKWNWFDWVATTAMWAFVIILFIFFPAWYFFGAGALLVEKMKQEGTEAKASVSRKFTSPIVYSSGSRSILPMNLDGCKKVREFWEMNLPKDEAEVMTKHAVRESNCNQFNPDGSVYQVVPKNDKDDQSALGVMMIKESVHEDEVGDFDLETWDGNLGFALFLVEKRKEEGKPFDIDWAETSDTTETVIAQSGDIVVDAPVGAWGKRIDITHSFCQGIPDREMLVRGDGNDGKVFKLGPHNVPNTSFRTVEYSTEMKPAGKLMLHCS